MEQSQPTTRFSDLGIKPSYPALVGDKIRIDKILNCEIIVKKFRIGASNFPEKGNGKCLHMQIEFAQADRVVFSGSGVLQEMIEKIPKEKFPFKTTIIKENDRLVFT